MSKGHVGYKVAFSGGFQINFFYLWRLRPFTAFDKPSASTGQCLLSCSR